MSFFFFFFDGLDTFQTFSYLFKYIFKRISMCLTSLVTITGDKLEQI